MREIKIYNNHYSGDYYDIINVTKDDVNKAKSSKNIENLTFEKVDNSELLVGETYFNESGSTIKLLDGHSYEVVERTPLRAGFKITELNALQTILFWTLVINCKNGTYSGV